MRTLAVVLALATGVLVCSCAGVVRVFPPGAAARTALASNALYAVRPSTNDVAVFAPPSSRMLRTLADPAMLAPVAVAFDAAGNAFVSSAGGGPKALSPGIFAFHAGASRPFSRIVNGLHAPGSLAFDRAGNLYVADGRLGGACPACFRGGVVVYAPGTARPARTISSGVTAPSSIAVDGAGTVYVANAYGGSGGRKGNVQVYASGANEPARTIVRGVHGPLQLLLDRFGTLFVANDDGSVAVYRRGASVPVRTIRARRTCACAIALGAGGTLYVMGRGVRVYPPGSSAPARTIRDVREAMLYGALAVDAGANVYVAENPAGCGRAPYQGACVRAFRAPTYAPWFKAGTTTNAAFLAFGP